MIILTGLVPHLPNTKAEFDEIKFDEVMVSIKNQPMTPDQIKYFNRNDFHLQAECEFLFAKLGLIEHDFSIGSQTGDGRKVRAAYTHGNT